MKTNKHRVPQIIVQSVLFTFFIRLQNWLPSYKKLFKPK